MNLPAGDDEQLAILAQGLLTWRSGLILLVNCLEQP